MINHWSYYKGRVIKVWKIKNEWWYLTKSILSIHEIPGPDFLDKGRHRITDTIISKRSYSFSQ